MIFATGFWDCQTGWCPDVTSLRLLDTIEAGAKKVIISAPGKGDLKTLVSFQQGYFFRFYVISKPWFLKRPG